MFSYNLLKSSVLITILFLLFGISNAFCWSGIDQESNSEIEIGSGNLVRENLIITIFDWNSNQHHDVEILEFESSFSGTTLTVFDLEIKEKRVFEME